MISFESLGPNKPTVGISANAERCISPESFPINSFDFFIIKNISTRSVFPTKSKIGTSFNFNKLSIDFFSFLGPTIIKYEFLKFVFLHNFFNSEQKF